MSAPLTCASPITVASQSTTTGTRCDRLRRLAQSRFNGIGHRDAARHAALVGVLEPVGLAARSKPS